MYVTVFLKNDKVFAFQLSEAVYERFEKDCERFDTNNTSPFYCYETTEKGKRFIDYAAIARIEAETDEEHQKHEAELNAKAQARRSNFISS